VHYDDGKIKTVPINQNNSTHFWASLGTYWFWPGIDYVTLDDDTGEHRYKTKIVADAMKFSASTIYLPDIRNSDSWVSSIVIRNNQPKYALVGINYYDIDGEVSYQKVAIKGNGSVIKEAPSGFFGSAVIVASEDVSAVAKIKHNNSDSTYAYNGSVSASSLGNPTFEHIGNILYTPSVYNNKWGWNTTLELMNTGSATNSVEIRFKGRTGYGEKTKSYNINPNDKVSIPASDVWDTSWVGSSIIKSNNNQPLAATLHEHHTSQAARAYNASASGSNVFYLPAAYKDKWGMTSGLIVQNVDTEHDTIARLSFYDRYGIKIPFEKELQIDAERAQGFWIGGNNELPTGWTGWIKVESINGEPLAVYVNTVYSGRHYSHTGATKPGKTIFLPWASRNANGRSTGYTMLNTSDSPIDVTATYYDTTGYERHSEEFYLSKGEVKGRHQAKQSMLPDGWQGSIVLQVKDNSSSLVAVIREDTDNTTSAYTGIAR
jgi:hypothetical protein